MSPMSHTAYYTINPDIVYTLIDDEAVIMDIENDQLYAANMVATELLQLLEKTTLTIPMMQTYLTEQFEVGAAECLSDIELLMEAFLEKKFVMTVSHQS